PALEKKAAKHPPSRAGSPARPWPPPPAAAPAVLSRRDPWPRAPPAPAAPPAAGPPLGRAESPSATTSRSPPATAARRRGPRERIREVPAVAGPVNLVAGEISHGIRSHGRRGAAITLPRRRHRRSAAAVHAR